jgi:hypothetical protein
VIDGKVTICGGYDLHYRDMVSEECFQLDHSQAVWKPFPSLNHARYKSGEAHVAQGWWVIGGTGTKEDPGAAYTTEIFKDGAWQAGPEIPFFDSWKFFMNLHFCQTLLYPNFGQISF